MDWDKNLLIDTNHYHDTTRIKRRVAGEADNSAEIAKAEAFKEKFKGMIYKETAYYIPLKALNPFFRIGDISPTQELRIEITWNKSKEQLL